jgi:hypothetical protein
MEVERGRGSREEQTEQKGDRTRRRRGRESKKDMKRGGKRKDQG